MGRGVNRLTPLQVRKTRKPMVNDGLGLWLRTKPAKGGGYSKSWLFRFALDGTRDQMGLGNIHDCGLAEARDKRDAARRLLKEGINPRIDRDRRRAEQRLANRPVVVFRDAAREYIDAHDSQWGATYTKEWRDTLSQYASGLDQLPVDAINVEDVLRVLQPHWEAKRPTMSRVRGRIESILDAAKARGQRSGDNPASWRTLRHLLSKTPKKGDAPHFEALPFAEVAGFLDRLRKEPSVAARGLEFLVLTAARTAEVRGATWDEIDFKERVWLVPARRMKARVEHKVPLSDAAIAVLKQMCAVQSSDLVFAHSGGVRGLSKLIRRMDGRVTVHGFRSTFRDWAAEKTNFQNHVIEKALAHKIPSAVEAAYRRGDLFAKRRALMDAWARHCTGATGSKVVKLRA
jgi:integrase